jgi:succinoglycan biosynthesis transport protein ExoP
MESAEAELQRYSTKSGLLMTEEKHVVAEEKLRQIQQELSTVQAERMSRESQFNTARSAPADSLPAVLDHGPLRELQLKLTELRRQLAEMSSLLTPTNYKVQRVQAQIAELENALKSERSRVLERLKNEFETASYRQALLKSAYEKQVQAVTDQARLKIRYDTLKHNAESSRTLYADLLQKVNTVGIISAIPASNVRVIEAGRVPSAPYKPVPLLGAILGGLAGLVLSSSIIILRYITDGSLRRPGEASQYLQVKELGAIPTARISAPDLHHARRLNGSSTHRRLSSPGAGLSVGGVFTSPVSNVTNGMLIDSLEAISASILFSSTRSSAIVVTSPRAKEGKTTISSHLAVSLAETGRRVLLVDGDMRAPRLHEIFDLPNEPGLGEMLTAASRKGQMDPASYAHQTSIPGLYVLTSGSWPNSSALFQEPLLNALFRQFRSNFDVTLMDTPPMLLTPVARLLGRSADAVALVLRAGKTSLETAMLCQQRLEHDGANLLGTILNDWNPESKVYEYYSAKR